MLPPRSRTPLTEPDEFPYEVASSLRPPTPSRRLLRPKFSSLFSTQAATSRLETLISENVVKPQFPSWAVGNPFPTPDAEQLIDAVMCCLMSDPYTSLDPRWNSMLLQIFEAYRALKDEKEQLTRKLDEESYGRFTDRLDRQERMEYKAEVKRLELIIAKGKRGLAEVSKARQESVLRRRRPPLSSDEEEDAGKGMSRKETVFEFLERTKRFDGSDWNSQRATMRVRPASPSSKMKALSRKLTKKASIMSLHADLPFGTPPPQAPPDIPSKSLTHISSNETMSTFSCAGDLLPDEVDEHTVAILVEDRSVVNDIDGRVPASPVHLEKSRSTSKALVTRSNGAKHSLGINLSNPSTASISRSAAVGSMRRPLAKASGLLNRLRPQQSTDSLSSPQRKFSFDPGDDTNPLAMPLGEASTHQEYAGALRKSLSLSSLTETLSRAQRSPASLGDGRRSSKIPSPIERIGARPRKEREASASSLLTAFEHPSGDLQRAPCSSSFYSTTSIGS